MADATDVVTYDIFKTQFFLQSLGTSLNAPKYYHDASLDPPRLCSYILLSKDFVETSCRPDLRLLKTPLTKTNACRFLPSLTESFQDMIDGIYLHGRFQMSRKYKKYSISSFVQSQMQQATTRDVCSHTKSYPTSTHVISIPV